MQSIDNETFIARFASCAAARRVAFAWLAIAPLACAGGSQQSDVSSSNAESASSTEPASANAVPDTASGGLGQPTSTPSPAAPATTTAGSANTPKTPAAVVVPALSVQSPNVQAMTGSGTAVAMTQVVFQDSSVSASSSLTGTNKQFEITALDYDPCPFYYAHARTSADVYNYKVAPTASFNFSGLYLVNNTPGTPLTAGIYTVGAASGMQVVTDAHTSGINFNVASCKIGNFQGFSSGTITVDAVSSDGKHTPVSGSMNLTTTDGGSLTGTFSIGHCTSGNTAYPIAPSPDPDACTL